MEMLCLNNSRFTLRKIIPLGSGCGKYLIHSHVFFLLLMNNKYIFIIYVNLVSDGTTS